MKQILIILRRLFPRWWRRKDKRYWPPGWGF